MIHYGEVNLIGVKMHRSNAGSASSVRVFGVVYGQDSAGRIVCGICPFDGSDSGEIRGIQHQPGTMFPATLMLQMFLESRFVIGSQVLDMSPSPPFTSGLRHAQDSFTRRYGLEIGERVEPSGERCANETKLRLAPAKFGSRKPFRECAKPF